VRSIASSIWPKLDAATALAASGALSENVNYAVKSNLLLSFLESVPDISAKLKAPVTVDRKFEDLVKSAQQAAVLVLMYRVHKGIGLGFTARLCQYQDPCSA
jgi:hypothetical protein